MFVATSTQALLEATDQEWTEAGPAAGGPRGPAGSVRADIRHETHARSRDLCVLLAAVSFCPAFPGRPPGLAHSSRKAPGQPLHRSREGLEPGDPGRWRPWPPLDQGCYGFVMKQQSLSLAEPRDPQLWGRQGPSPDLEVSCDQVGRGAVSWGWSGDVAPSWRGCSAAV